MKKLMMITLMMCLFNISCTNKKVEQNFENIGKTIVENGKGVPDTIPYNCVGCKENLNKTLFDDVIKESTKIARNGLRYPLSFIPIKMDIVIIKKDSLYNFDDGKKIDSTFLVINKYFYIGKNGMGNELEGDDLVSFYVKNGKITDLSESIKLEDLKFDGGYINRSLDCYDNEEGYIEFIPTKDKSIIIKSSLSCVEESTLKIIFDNEEEITLSSWNDFNCEGTSYFYWFNKKDVEKLKINKIKYIYINSRSKSVLANIPKNKSDYFKQLLMLYK